MVGGPAACGGPIFLTQRARHAAWKKPACAGASDPESPTASAAFAVPLPVLVVNDRDGVKHRGTLQLPRRAPAAAPGRPSSADLARLRPLMLLCDLCQRCVQEMFERRVQYKILACWY